MQRKQKRFVIPKEVIAASIKFKLGVVDPSATEEYQATLRKNRK